MENLEIENLYDRLENEVHNYSDLNQFVNLFIKFRDQNAEINHSELVEIAQFEIDCLKFVNRNGEIKSQFKGTDGEGKPWEYPSINKLNDKHLQYIEERLKNTSNHMLIVRYSSILWESPQKHNDFAILSIDSNLELVKYYEKMDKENPTSNNGLYLINSILNASYLALKINYRVDDIHSEIVRLIKEFNSESDSTYVVRFKLIDHMLTRKTKFSKGNYHGIPEICKDLGNQSYEKGRLYNAIDFFETGEKIDNKLAKETINWSEKIAEIYEEIMEERDESDFASAYLCQKAIEKYKKVKNEEKIQELEEKYKNLKKKLHFTSYGQKVDVENIVKYSKEIAEKICDRDPNKIISLLANDKSILPTLKETKKISENFNKEFFTSILPHSTYDLNGHPTENFTTDDEIKYYHILSHYNWDIKVNREFLINEIFCKAVEMGKINLHFLMEYFKNNSWYGKNIKKTIAQKEITYNWLNLLAPSINEYFYQMDAHYSNNRIIPNFVLAIDSLCIKIEGLIRDICTLSGITTFYQQKDKNGGIIVREKDINWLLREECIKQLFDEDDLLFFKFILIEKGGKNLRHKIAHCLINYEDYNISNMHLLFLIVLKLGKYDFVKNEDVVEEKVAD